MTVPRIGRYEVQKELGKGSQGVVYLARDPQLERYVAIKMQRIKSNMGGTRQTRLIEEARTISKLTHPNIVSVYDVGEYNKNVYFVLEYVDGVSIREIIRNKGPFVIHRAVSIISRVLGGIGYMHGKGVIHGDMTPSNILIDAEGIPRIMDFGIAMMGRAQSAGGGSYPGTPRYMSPEHFQKAPPGPQSDLFSLALVFCEMLTGSPVFEADNQYKLMYMIVNKQVAAPSKSNPEISPKLDEMILKALEKAPASRFANAEEMKEALDSFLKPEKEEETESSKSSQDRHATVKFLLRRMRRNKDFPAFSKNVANVNRKLSGESEDLSASDLANVILKDYALTNKLLRLVNSAFYGVTSGKISTVSRAVAVLGFDQVRLAAASLMLFDQLKGDAQGEKLANAAVGSFMSGMFAKNISATVGAEAEEGFICGMLHKLGVHLVLFYFPEEYKEIDKEMAQKGVDEQAASRTVLGIPYHDLGMAVARMWKFPDRVIETMEPLPPGKIDKAKSPNDLLRGVANFSNELCELLEDTQKNGRSEKLSEISKRFRKIIPISKKQLVKMLETSKTEIEKYSSVFSINISKSSLYKNLTAQPDSRKPSSTVDAVEPKTPPGTTEPASDTSPENEMGDAASLEQLAENSLQTLLTGIQEITNSLTNGTALNDVVVMLLETMYRGFGCTRVIFCLMNPRRNSVSARFGFGKDMDVLLKKFDFKISKTMDVFTAAILQGKDVIIRDSASSEYRRRVPDWYRRIVNAPAFAIFPIVVNKRGIGLFYLDRDTTGPPIPDEQVNFMNIFRNQFLIAMKQGH